MNKTRLTLQAQYCCAVAIFLVSCFPIAAPHAVADEPNATTAPVEYADRCNNCHYCAVPTREAPCLRPCDRPTDPLRARNGAAELGPDIVILDELAHDYLPVPFDHRGHAAMADMGEGCLTCHHHTPEGSLPPPCKSCHAADIEGTDIHKPGLKGAYHQQCLNCHRDWTDEKNCEVCHHPKTGDGHVNPATVSLNTEAVLGQMHPPIPAPEGDLYRGRPDQTGSARVLFGHQTHVERFGLKCVECHRERGCARCHGADRQSQRPTILVEHHRPCIGCHKNDMDLLARDAGRCERCHWADGTPRPESFAHANTGWPLRLYHQRISCRQCHPDVPFAALDTRCSACHEPWPPDPFDHRVTGQALDETHAEIDCASCHPNGAYEEPPTCTECHDPEDGVSFPDKRPGPSANPADLEKQTALLK